MTEARQSVVVVGIDGSESSKHALRWAVRQAQLSGAEPVALTVWHLPEMYGYVGRVRGDAAGIGQPTLRPPRRLPGSRGAAPQVLTPEEERR